MTTILILCTGNSCRSQMAEGFLRSFAGNEFEIQSAGSHPSGYVHPLAIRAMGEVGVDLAGYRSKHLNEFLDREIHSVISVCGNADQACPIFPGRMHRHHFPFDDPANAVGNDDELMIVFRRVRDEIRMIFEAYAAGLRDAS
ncbi:MAG: arsenate reductase ArsC [Akkermansiaceae bacterium]|nr:arsenate reductase ArsC [Akkermansiaceae bacterium]